MLDRMIEVLANLTQILSPPSVTSHKDWSGFEVKENLYLPADYKEFISVYGGGVIDDFLWVLSPFANNRNLSFEKSKYFQESYLEVKKELPADYPRPKYPSQGSFIPWAVTDNGETLVWIVEGKPESWGVAVHSSDQGCEEVYNIGCVEFILKILRREISSSILPVQFPPEGQALHVFKRTD
ncbi:hypothetical protein PS3A_44300 [Pseudomonas sp. 3A(2025)]